MFEFNCHGSPKGCDLLSHGSTVTFDGGGFDNHGSAGCVFTFPFVVIGVDPFCSQASFDGAVD